MIIWQVLGFLLYGCMVQITLQHAGLKGSTIQPAVTKYGNARKVKNMYTLFTVHTIA